MTDSKGPDSTDAPSKRPRMIHLPSELGALFDQGDSIRNEVVGRDHVERSWSNVTPLTRPLQEMATSTAWGLIWGSDQLTRKERSILNLGILSSLNRMNEFKVHVKGALNNGLKVEELSSILCQIMVYSGAPAGLEAGRVAQVALDEWQEERKRKREGEGEESSQGK
ncbi:4-carboxymuconolactone decarboxylase [Violaceomyces palustris]|uniref:4-carboxymuconolactone decarboxylase n=1 Tax=Violaceomyces palustris TaxID=1673888 RepID=A0ACD0P541_9BASI|nr:4-carboxymuconolactone decarboxylase [Violaceomyces palustris]